MLESIVTSINDVVWSLPLIIMILGTGIYFSIRMKFPQVRLLKEMFRLLNDNKGKGSKEGVSGLRAFIMTAAGRVGVGNIAGMATAIALGGP
ncbi:MAG: alanine:cation symporter family protein, partial [Eubacterium sp.]